MKNKFLLLLFVWIISLVSCDPGTLSSPSFNSNCVCVDFQYCHNRSVNLFGENLFDYKAGSITNISVKCTDAKQVCCFLENKPYITESVDYTKCGIYNSNIVAIAGEYAQQGEFPWMVVVLRGGDHTYVSGGSLIHPKVVMTAAHKLYDRKSKKFVKNLAVRVGSNVRTDNVGFEVTVQIIIPHIHFSYKTSRNNIALLILKNDLPLGPNIQTICLPNTNKIFKSKICTAIGFGKTNDHELNINEKLKKINLPLLTNDICEQKLRFVSRATPQFVLDNSLLCAGVITGKDTCKGDGGSPLICLNDKYYYQVGIVSYGFGCFRDSVPGVYTNVSHLYQWIIDTFNANGLETKWFTPQ